MPAGPIPTTMSLSAIIARYSRCPGVFGTIVVGILAAAVASGSGHESGWEAVAILIGIGTALINIAHVVGLAIMESIRYRGGFAKFFRTMALTLTPLAIVVNTAILIFAD